MSNRPPGSWNPNVNKITAGVYAGAAFLILVVGLRTVLLTRESGNYYLMLITITALVIEFGLLLAYAYTILIHKDESAIETLVGDVTVNVITDELRDELNSLRSSLDKTNMIFNEFGKRKSVDLNTDSLENSIGDLITQIKEADGRDEDVLNIGTEIIDLLRSESESLANITESLDHAAKDYIERIVRSELTRILESSLQD